jgi:hypothetical protein
MTKLLFQAALTAACLCAAAGTAGAAGIPAAPDGMEPYTADGNFFTALVPSGWEKNENITQGRQSREFGVDLKGPQNKRGAFLRISIIYYSPDHPRFKTHEKYLRLNSKPDPTLRIKGETYGPVKPLTVAGRRGTQFERKTFDFIPPYAVDPKKVPVYEYRAVIPGKKGGFYAIIYHAPEDLRAANAALFKKVLGGFKPLR